MGISHPALPSSAVLHDEAVGQRLGRGNRHIAIKDPFPVTVHGKAAVADQPVAVFRPAIDLGGEVNPLDIVLFRLKSKQDTPRFDNRGSTLHRR